jgi:hypothetical protein
MPRGGDAGVAQAIEKRVGADFQVMRGGARGGEREDFTG